MSKCFRYTAAFVLFHITIIVILSLTALRIKTPDAKLGSLTIEKFSTDNGTLPSLSMTFIAEIAVKNKNFGHFKFDNSKATISYGGIAVGEALIPKGRAKERSTRKMNVTVEVSSDRLSSIPNLSNDINSGSLALTSHAKLRGKVHLIKLIKKRKTADLNCRMTFNLANRSIQDLNC